MTPLVLLILTGIALIATAFIGDDENEEKKNVSADKANPPNSTNDTPQINPVPSPLESSDE
ncbi:hypothetical protein [Sulfitobacter sp.]|uniref:hypothetical protein n=1 Tax=Sulfitobacter sp. TaxID=1903071 RepID=UPI0032984672